jgi:hypothetical protein
MEKIPIALQVIQMAFEMLDPDDIQDILEQTREIDLETCDLLTKVARDLGKLP